MTDKTFTIERKELLAACSAAAPALAKKSAAMSHLYLWFSPEHVTAFDDVLGIQVPFRSGLEIGVNGALLLGLLNASLAKQAALTAHENELEIKLAGSKAEVPVLSTDQSILEAPAIPKKGGLPIDKHFLSCLEHVRLSVSSDGYAGVSFIPDKKWLMIFATDGRTISWASTKISGGDGYGMLPERLDVPERFCEQVVALCDNEKGTLYLAEDRILAVCGSNKTLVYSRVMEPNKSLDYVGTRERLRPKDEPIPVPPRLGMALERAAVLSAGATLEKASFSLADGELRINLSGPLGTLNERIPLEGKHSKQQADFDCAPIRRGVAKLESFQMTDECMVMSADDDRGYIIAALG